MKTLLFLLLFIPLLSAGQNIISDSTKLWTNETPFSFANVKPANKFTFCGGGNKSFSIEFSGDSLISSGDLKLNESAKIFIDYCQKYFKTKINSLSHKNDSLQKIIYQKREMAYLRNDIIVSLLTQLAEYKRKYEKNNVDDLDEMILKKEIRERRKD